MRRRREHGGGGCDGGGGKKGRNKTVVHAIPYAGGSWLTFGTGLARSSNGPYKARSASWGPSQPEPYPITFRETMGGWLPKVTTLSRRRIPRDPPPSPTPAALPVPFSYPGPCWRRFTKWNSSHDLTAIWTETPYTFCVSVAAVPRVTQPPVSQSCLRSPSVAAQKGGLAGVAPPRRGRSRTPSRPLQARRAALPP